MEKFILDESLRLQIVQNAHKRVSVDYDMDKNIKLWDNVYRDVHDKFHQFFGEKKHFMVIKEGKNKKYKQVSVPIEYI